MKSIFLILSIFILMGTACNIGKSNTQETVDSTKTAATENKVTEAPKKEQNCDDAKAWLEKMIPSYFNDNEGELGVMKVMTTPQYYAYKVDAMNVDMGSNESMSQAAFEQKWKDKYDVKKAGIQSGFLITGQDWDKISVEKCEFTEARNDTCIFNVVLADKKWNERYPSIVKVINWGNLFVIGDVLQPE